MKVHEPCTCKVYLVNIIEISATIKHAFIYKNNGFDIVQVEDILCYHARTRKKMEITNGNTRRDGLFKL